MATDVTLQPAARILFLGNAASVVWPGEPAMGQKLGWSKTFYSTRCTVSLAVVVYQSDRWFGCCLSTINAGGAWVVLQGVSGENRQGKMMQARPRAAAHTSTARPQPPTCP